MLCVVCGRPFDWTGRGRRRSVCGQRCRKRRSRAEVPVSLTRLDRWACADGKRPVRVDGRAASSTDPATWTSYAAVSATGRPHGLMCGDGLACWDLDDVLDEQGALHRQAAAVLDTVGSHALHVERSLSGRGLHVFVHGAGTAQVSEHISYYPSGRFIVVTGQRYWRC